MQIADLFYEKDDTQIWIVYEGSGDPSEQHTIAGVLKKEGDHYTAVGGVELSVLNSVIK